MVLQPTYPASVNFNILVNALANSKLCFLSILAIYSEDVVARQCKLAHRFTSYVTIPPTTMADLSNPLVSVLPELGLCENQVKDEASPLD